MNDEMIERLSEVLLSGLELEVIHQGRGGHGFNTASIKMRLERVLSALTPADLEALVAEKLPGYVIVPENLSKEYELDLAHILCKVQEEKLTTYNAEAREVYPKLIAARPRHPQGSGGRADRTGEVK